MSDSLAAQVSAALARIQNPRLENDLLSAGMIRDLQVTENGHVSFTFLLSRNDPATLARARAWWGTEVTSFYDGSSVSAPLTGLMTHVAHDACPQAECTAIAIEYGTEPPLEVLDALRGDHWLARHPEAPAELADAIKARVRRAFYTDTDAWKRQIWTQAREALHQAARGLSG